MRSVEAVESPWWQALLPQLQLDFRSAIYHHCAPKWRIRPRVTPDEMLQIVHAGTVRWRVDEKEYDSPAGSLFLCPPNVKWEAWRTSTEMVKMTVLHFDANLPGGQRYLQTLNYPLHITPLGFRRYEVLARTLCRSYAEAPPGHELKERAVLFDILNRLFPYHGEVSSAGGPGHQMLKIAGYLQSNMDGAITRETLAQRFHLSSGHLAAQFKQYLGQSPIDYLITLRVESAAKMLRTTELTIGEVARNVGYEDMAYFSRIFKRATGVTPSQYRREEAGYEKGA